MSDKMKEYIEKDAALQDMWNALYKLEDQREKLHGLDLFERKNLQDGFEAGQGVIANFPAADVVEVVRCKYCKHRIVNEHYGEKGYIKLKAYCELDTGDIFSLGRCAEDDDWFCRDGERKGGDE